MLERRVDIKEYLSSKEYSLAPGVLFVPGASRGALYDINTGRVFSLNPIACKILTHEEDNPKYWGKLEDLGLATREKIEKESVLPELIQKPKLQFVWFELISDDCNQSCIHCYADSMPPSYRKELGLATGGYIPLNDFSERNVNKQKINTQEWKGLIEDTYSLGCRRCQFIGGEPFIYKGDFGETVLDLAQFSKSLGYEFVEIFTNATLLTQDKVKRIKNLGINVAVSLHSKDPDIHDGITKTPGSHNKTITALNRLKEAGVPTRVETVLMKPNEFSIEETQDFIREMGFSSKNPDVLRPKGRGDNPATMPSKKSVIKYGIMTSPNFQVDEETLLRHLSGHSCLLGKITITDNGDILPCIFSRNYAVGNVKNNSLQEIVAGQKLETVWRNTKDQILVCQDCEYRYACFDCRPLSEGVNQGKGDYLSAPYPRCTYNPYTGEWGRGVWRINEDGKPYYDETLKPIIEEVMATKRLENDHSNGH